MAQFDYFFDLPGELRRQILGYLVVESGGVMIGQRGPWSRAIGGSPSWSFADSDTDDQDDDDADTLGWPLNYFLVSHAFHREVTAVYFRQNTFYLLATGRKPATTYPGPCERLLGDPRYRDSRRRMRKIVLYIKALRGVLVDGVFKPLADMVLAGGLKHLEIRVWWFQAKGSGMLASVPMQAMYRVLKDPDLESARLQVVAGRHEVAWCSFHAAGTGPLPCSDARLGKKGRGTGPPAVRDGVQWVEIDVEGLVKQYGDVEEALRILKVGD